MKLFNRKNDERIDEILEKIDDMCVRIQILSNQNEDKDIKIKELEDKLKDMQKKYNYMDTDIKEVKDSSTALYEYFNNKINELSISTSDFKKFKVDVYKYIDNYIQKLSESEEPAQPKEDNHLFKVPERVSTPYTHVELKGNDLFSAKRKFSFNIENVIGIKENLKEYNDKGMSLRAIAKKHNIGSDVIYRLIWNIEEGVFDEVIAQYKKQREESERKHCRKVSDSQKRGLNINNIEYNSDGELYSRGRKLHYTIDDIKLLKERIPDFENYPSNSSLLGDLNIGEYGGSILIWRIEEGYYDELIKKYDNGIGVNNDVVDEKNYHIFKLGKSYHTPFDNLQVGHGGELYSRNNQRLSFTIFDVIELKNRIYSNKYKVIKELYDGFDMSRQLCNKIIWNIEEGNFDELIEEYSTRNYTYENKINRLYIDGEDTGLTIDNCNFIIECLINENNKQKALNRLIKNYPATKPKYIRILGEEYNNINLNKVLKKEVPKVEKQNNPQKRREQGIYFSAI